MSHLVPVTHGLYLSSGGIYTTTRENYYSLPMCRDLRKTSQEHLLFLTFFPNEKGKWPLSLLSKYIYRSVLVVFLLSRSFTSSAVNPERLMKHLLFHMLLIQTSTYHTWYVVIYFPPVEAQGTINSKLCFLHNELYSLYTCHHQISSFFIQIF